MESVPVPSATDVTPGSEEALMAAMQAGEEAAFEQVVREYGPRLLAVTRRMLGREEDAQDAFQDALLSAFKAIGSFKSEARLSTWLHRITVNAALMKLRTQKRQTRNIEDLLPRFHDDGHRQNPDPAWAIAHDTAVADRETRAVVRQFIDELPDAYREVIVLRDIEERSTEETATALGVNEGVVKTRLHRARQALRTLLAPYMHEHA
jgi:RNA polymerase sigma-70 factor (ECF subfamily)